MYDFSIGLLYERDTTDKITFARFDIDWATDGNDTLRVQAGFAASPASGTAPLTVFFSNTSRGDYTTSLWSFGDNSPPSNEDNPTHTYEVESVYTVTLTVKGPRGTDTATKSDFIRVLHTASLSIINR
jgi:PKD repeat protein